MRNKAKLRTWMSLLVMSGLFLVLIAQTGFAALDARNDGMFLQPTPTDTGTINSAEEVNLGNRIFLPVLNGGSFLVKVTEIKNIIVGLRLSTGTFAPEGSLGNSTMIVQQQSEIISAREALLRSLAGYNVEVYGSWDSLPYLALKVDDAAYEQVVNSPYVTTTKEDSLSQPHLASAGHHIGADVTWDAGYGGLGQTVVILDTGIDADHPFYGGRVVTEACFSAGAGGVSLCPNGANNQTGLGAANALTAQCLNGTAQLCDHGSHVAGIAAGRDPGGPGATGYNGIAPEANIIAIQVFTRFNSTGDCSPAAPPCVLTWDSDQLSALNYVNNTLRTSWNIAAVNMSLGGGMNTSACDGDGRKAAIDNLWSNGIATVISAGNDDWTDALSAPGCISTAVTVGNVFDPSDDVTDNMHAVVDLLAAGRSVDSSIPDDTYGNKSGTSMAAPQVTGAFAMLKAVNPSMSVGDILELLKTTGVLVRDERAPNPATANAGHVKPRIQLDAAVAELTMADLRIFKDCKPEQPMYVGETATCTIMVDNLGPDSAMAVVAVDEFVSNGVFEFGAVTTTSGTCDITANPQTGAGTVTCAIGGMAKGSKVIIKVPVTANSAQDINDLVTVSSTTPDPDPWNNSAGDTVTAVALADLALTKQALPNPVVAGTQLVYTLEVTNHGPSSAANVVVEDVLPAGVTFVSVSSSGGTCNAGVPGDGNLPTTCTFDSMAVSSVETMQVVVNVNPETLGILGNNAKVFNDFYDPDNSNNLATVATTVETNADLSVSKTDFPDPVMAGAMLTYGLTVHNNGPSTALDVFLDDNFPLETNFLGYTISSGSGSCNLISGTPESMECGLNDIGPGTSVVVNVVVLVDPSVVDGTMLSNTVNVSSATSDSIGPNNSDTEETLVHSEADLSITKDANFLTDNPAPRIVYTLVVSNRGSSDAQDVLVVDDLPLTPKEIVYVMDSGNGACSYDETSHDVSCNFGTLQAGGSITVDIVVDAKGSVDRITNTATVSSTTTDPDLSNNTAIKEIRVKGGPGIQ